MFSGRAGLLHDSAKMVMRAILGTSGAADVWAGFGFQSVGAHVHRVKLRESVIEEYGKRGADALLDHR